jgi:hypothetical protein
MTPKVRQRLRTYLLENEVEGRDLWDVTLTIPGDISLEDWDLSKRRYFRRLERASVGVVWRVELQTRKTPHLHLIVWVPKGSSQVEVHKLIRFSWLECLPDVNRYHEFAFRYAVVLKGPFTDAKQAPEWMAYLAGHASKKKQSQLGWVGKQWGVVGRRLFASRPSLLRIPVYSDQEKWFKRLLSRFLYSKQRAKYLCRIAQGKKGLRRPIRRKHRPNTRMSIFIKPEIAGRLAELACLSLHAYRQPTPDPF